MSGRSRVTYELDEGYLLFDMESDDLTLADSDSCGFGNLVGMADPMPDDLS
ncbi:hypothetical protein [Streptomyces sp. NPDC046261]|uniref:hypothetical protein n=1 Tax=Streptomyces sp. NPDC046261 TaxID=3157200 RepID=UPI0033DD7BC1